MKEFNDAVLGGYSIGQFAGYFFWAIMGVFIVVQFNVNTRDRKGDRTPEQFKWSFWFRDNARRVAFNVALIFATIRFSQQVTGREINEWWSFVIGLSFDLLALVLNKFRLLKLIGTATLTPGERVDGKLAEPGDQTIVIEKKEEGL